MKRTLICWCITLLTALGLIIRLGLAEWRAARLREVAVLASESPEPEPPRIPIPKPEPARKEGGAEIANANLFSPDRNPDVLLPVDPPKPIPALPIVYGVFSLSARTRAIMAANPGDTGRTVQQGDAVGAFRIVRLDAKEVAFNWEDREIVRPIADLINRSGAARAGDPQPVAEPQTTPANALAIAAGPGPANPGQTRRPCVAGDDSPIGTVIDGFRKVLVPGSSAPRDCYWSSER
jgi:hypothetical protein